MNAYMRKVMTNIKKYKGEVLGFYYRLRDDMTKDDAKELLIIVILCIICFPFMLIYEIIIRPVYKTILTLIDMQSIGFQKAFRKNFLEKDDDIDAEIKTEDEIKERLTLDGEIAKTFCAKKLWPDAVVKDCNALYSSDGRTLLYVHENVEEYIIPEGTENVYHKCFMLCTKLRTVTFPSTIKRIGNQAFSSCVLLKNLVVPESVESIGYAVFKNCVSLESVKLPSSMVEIPEEMFYNCRVIKDITIPINVNMICKRAFARCTSLEHIHLNEGLEMIREKAFEDCWSLKEFIMPERVRFIEVGTFNNCHSMEKLHLSMNMKSFGGSCCENCWNLHEVTMSPDSAFLKRMHQYWEEYSDDFKPEDSEYPYPENIFWFYNNALYSGIPRLSNTSLILCLSKEEEFTIPDFVFEVKQYAFTTCKNLKRLRLSPKLHPKANDWDERSYITHDFIYEFWPQVEEVVFDESLNPKQKKITFV